MTSDIRKDLIMDEREVLLAQLAGWGKAIADVIEKHKQAIITGESTEEEEQPRDKLARLVRQVGEIHTSVQDEVYSA